MMRDHQASQTFVMLAMGLVCVALAVAVYQHAGLPGPVAATAALSAYVLLLTLHVFLWRSNSGSYTAASKDRREAELRRVKEEAKVSAALTKAQVLGHAQTKTQAQAQPAPAQPASMQPDNTKLTSPALPKAGPTNNVSPQGAAAKAPSSRETASMPEAAQAAARAVPNAPQSRAPAFNLDALGIDDEPTLPLHAPLSAPAWTSPSPQGRNPASPSQPLAPPPLPPSARLTPPPLTARAPDSTGSDNQDYWSFRPASQPTLPPFVTGRVNARGAHVGDQPNEPTFDANRYAETARAPVPAPTLHASPREADVEIIQDAIKRLLVEVNAAERKETVARQQDSIAAQRTEDYERSANEAAIEQSLDALRHAASSMRAAEARDQRPAEPRTHLEPPPLPADAAPHPHTWGSAPQVVSPSQARARILADAITAGRIDVTLEPILGLEDQKTRHYEVAIRLRDANGTPLNVHGDGPDLRGTGLLPLFDSVGIARVAAVARKLDERGKGGSVFSTFSGESIADDQFVGELAETLHQRGALATQLVLSFSQADVRHLSTPEWDSLAEMRALGFRFAISSITDLDMDFEELAEQGFAFAKLDASVFLQGLPAANGNISANDVCRFLAKVGLTLVIEHIDSDEQAARIFGFGVLLGQGHLFGGPRPVRAEAVTKTAAA
ncbi:MAG: EAL domain-containing protein [Hyphomicrobium sp.]|jgi:cyclic-di-GMP phosphodiesterase TipF (flagellum assembly factor)